MSDEQQMNQWQEAKEAMGSIIRWDEQADPGQEQTIYIGNVVQGIFVGKKGNIGQNQSTLYEISLADGRLVSVWGSKLLDGKFDQIPQNSEVRITYLGMQKAKTSGGRAYRNFKVEFAKPVMNMTEVQNNQASAVDEGY